MKNYVMGCLLLVAVGLAGNVQAQISIGAKGGLNVSSLPGVNSQEYSTKPLVGFHIGAFATYNFGRRVALQPELVYSTQGTTLEYVDEVKYKINYINIPVMLKVMSNKGAYVEVGPQLGFNVGNLNLDNFGESVESSDFSACFGVGFQPMKSPFGVGLRYNLGLGEAGQITDMTLDIDSYTNAVFQLSVYWRLFGGGKLKQ